jgi:hypothetical protein
LTNQGFSLRIKAILKPKAGNGKAMKTAAGKGAYYV